MRNPVLFVLALNFIALNQTSFAAEPKPEPFPELYNSEKTPGGPDAPEEALKKLKMPDGFTATLFAHEPDVQNPIGMAWDTRGRMWIAENYTYAETSKRFELKLRDRVTILEDTDHDGKFDKRTVFTDNVQMLTSVEVGHGGVWLMCPPQLIFIPDANHDDVPDGPPQVMLDGFEVAKSNYHNFANGLRWGPDGWLYGRCGASCPGLVGIPGTPAKDRIPLNGGMWRYHPKTRAFEALCHGTTNPWGSDWDANYNLFFVNTVNGHLWHAIPGEHLVRPHTVDPNPYAYMQVDMHADHWHFDTGKGWTASRNGAANDLGGGHAHCGTMVYLGDNWPDEYRGKLFTINFHGRRLNQEILEPLGAGIVAKHGQDVMLFGDTWFRGIDLSYGPDGGVYVLDWSDAGECHDSTGVHRTSGRIYKITYGTPKKPDLTDLRSLSDLQLVELHKQKNEWYTRMARLVLAERAETQKLGNDVLDNLKMLVSTGTDVEKIRALNTLHSTLDPNAAYCYFLDQAGFSQDSEQSKKEYLKKSPYVRAGILKLLCDHRRLDKISSERPEVEESKFTILPLKDIAQNDNAGPVQLALASILQRLPFDKRVEYATYLMTHKEFANDHDLPALVWTGLIPTAEIQPNELAKCGVESTWPVVRSMITRRLSELVEKSPDAVNSLIEAAAGKDEAFAKDVLTGMAQGFAAKQKVAKPKAWNKLAEKINAGQDAELKQKILDLSVLFGDGRALTAVKELALNGKNDLATRTAALQTLIDNKPPELREICEKLLSVKVLNVIAIKGLTQIDDPLVGKKIASAFPNVPPANRPEVMAALCSRPAFVPALLDDMEAGRIKKDELTPYLARQIHGFGDEAINTRLTTIWGNLKESNAELKKQILDWKTKLTPEMIAKGNPSIGRQLFKQTCMACHTLYGEGGHVGPDLTGAGRQNIDYILDNVVDPSAVVSADFRASFVALNDGRVLSGIIGSQSKESILLITPTERLTIGTQDIKKIKPSEASLMPDGLLSTLKPEQVPDLVSYLMTRAQVPLPDEKK